MSKRSQSKSNEEISGGASSSRPAGDAAAMSVPEGSGKSGPAHPPPVPGHDLVSIHVSPAAAVILSALAAERGVSVTRLVTILAVDAAEAIGLGRLAREQADDH
jgi:hypothetical protein